MRWFLILLFLCGFGPAGSPVSSPASSPVRSPEAVAIAAGSSAAEIITISSLTYSGTPYSLLDTRAKDVIRVSSSVAIALNGVDLVALKWSFSDEDWTLLDTASNATTAINSGICKLKDEGNGNVTIGVMHEQAQEINAWKFENNNFWKDTAATTGPSKPLVNNNTCAYYTENQMVARFSRQAQLLTYTSGVGFTSSSNITTVCDGTNANNCGIIDECFANGDCLFADHWDDNFKLYNLQGGQDWVRLSTTSASALAGIYEPCKVDENHFLAFGSDTLLPYLKDGTTITAEGTGTGDASGYIDNHRTFCVALSDSHAVTSAYGEPEFAHIDIRKVDDAKATSAYLSVAGVELDLRFVPTGKLSGYMEPYTIWYNRTASPSSGVPQTSYDMRSGKAIENLSQYPLEQATGVGFTSTVMTPDIRVIEELDNTASTFIQNLHKTTGGTDWTQFVIITPTSEGGVSRTFTETRETANTDDGVGFLRTGTDQLGILQGNGSVAKTLSLGSCGINAGVPNVFYASYDTSENRLAIGCNGTTYEVVGSFNTATGNGNELYIANSDWQTSNNLLAGEVLHGVVIWDIHMTSAQINTTIADIEADTGYSF